MGAWKTPATPKADRASLPVPVASSARFLPRLGSLRGPIVIDGDVGTQGFILGYTYAGKPIPRPGSGVSGGSGTAADPYILGPWRTPSVSISDTTAYFVLLNDTVEPTRGTSVSPAVPLAAASINLTNDRHAEVRDSFASFLVGQAAIRVRGSSDVRVDGGWFGPDAARSLGGFLGSSPAVIDVAGTSAFTFAGGTIEGGSESGIAISGLLLHQVTDARVVGASFANFSGGGIAFGYSAGMVANESGNVSVESTTISSADVGILAGNVTRLSVGGSDIANSEFGIVTFGTAAGFTGNTITSIPDDSSEGVEQDGPEGAVATGNTIVGGGAAFVSYASEARTSNNTVSSSEVGILLSGGNSTNDRAIGTGFGFLDFGSSTFTNDATLDGFLGLGAAGNVTTVRGFHSEEDYAGVLAEFAGGLLATGVNVTGATYSLAAWEVGAVSVGNSTLDGAVAYLLFDEGVTVENTRVTGGPILLFGSSTHAIRNDAFEATPGQPCGLVLDGFELDNYRIHASNVSACGRPLVYLADGSHHTVDGGNESIIAVNESDLVVHGVRTPATAVEPIFLAGNTNVTIRDSAVSEALFGLESRGDSNLTLLNDSIGAQLFGIEVGASARTFVAQTTVVSSLEAVSLQGGSSLLANDSLEAPVGLASFGGAVLDVRGTAFRNSTYGIYDDVGETTVSHSDFVNDTYAIAVCGHAGDFQNNTFVETHIGIDSWCYSGVLPGFLNVAHNSFDAPLDNQSVGIVLGIGNASRVERNDASHLAYGIVVAFNQTYDVHENNVEADAGAGVYALPNATVDASANWWGCAAGPGGTGCDAAAGAVSFRPVLFAPVDDAGRLS